MLHSCVSGDFTVGVVRWGELWYELFVGGSYINWGWNTENNFSFKLTLTKL